MSVAPKQHSGKIAFLPRAASVPRRKREMGITMIGLAGLALMGCAAASRRVSPEAAVAGIPIEAAAAGRAEQSAKPANGAGAVAMNAYEVREAAFSDFGMSVKTNFDVQWGGQVEWMIVTGVARGSSAARVKVGVGDRILAIDGRLVATMDREAMLERLFQRKQGDVSRVLVLSRDEPFPRMVTLIAARPEPRGVAHVMRVQSVRKGA